jgi:hypothetical protein
MDPYLVGHHPVLPRVIILLAGPQRDLYVWVPALYAARLAVFKRLLAYELFVNRNV